MAQWEWGVGRHGAAFTHTHTHTHTTLAIPTNAFVPAQGGDVHGRVQHATEGGEHAAVVRVRMHVPDSMAITVVAWERAVEHRHSLDTSEYAHACVRVRACVRVGKRVAPEKIHVGLGG